MDPEALRATIRRLHQNTIFLELAYQEDLRTEHGPFGAGTHYDHITRNTLGILYGYYEMLCINDPAAAWMGANSAEILDAFQVYLTIVAEREEIRTPEMTKPDGILGERHLLNAAWHDMLLSRVKAIIKYAEETARGEQKRASRGI